MLGCIWRWRLLSKSDSGETVVPHAQCQIPVPKEGRRGQHCSAAKPCKTSFGTGKNQEGLRNDCLVLPFLLTWKGCGCLMVFARNRGYQKRRNVWIVRRSQHQHSPWLKPSAPGRFWALCVPIHLHPNLLLKSNFSMDVGWVFNSLVEHRAQLSKNYGLYWGLCLLTLDIKQGIRYVRHQ